MRPRLAEPAASVPAWVGVAAASLLPIAAGCSAAAEPRRIAVPAATVAGPSFRSVRTLAAVSPPVRVRIPAAGVDAAVEDVGRARDGTVATPKSWHTVGWYDEGPRPGDLGPAVLLGHVDSRTGAAVFYRLPTLRRGDVVVVVRADGSSLRFAVQRVAEYPKRAFPTEQVYLPTLTPELRVVTCGGAFNAESGHYVDNVIVYAALVT